MDAPKLQSQIAMQKYNAKLQGKITLQNYKAKAKLHAKIARQNRKTKLQCKIARQHYKAKLQCKIAKQSYNAQLQDKTLFFVCGPSPDGALRGAGLSSVGWGLHKKIVSKIHIFYVARESIFKFWKSTFRKSTFKFSGNGERWEMFKSTIRFGEKC